MLSMGKLSLSMALFNSSVTNYQWVHKHAKSLGKFDHDLTVTSLEIIVDKGDYPQMDVNQVREYHN